MTQASCDTDPRVTDESFLPATLGFVRRCPARADYIELCFTTDEGTWNWCFPKPPEQPGSAGSPLALTIGRYGAQVHLVDGDRLGPALPSSEALPMILDDAQVFVARQLVARGR